jgi:hypothetical protein
MTRGCRNAPDDSLMNDRSQHAIDLIATLQVAKTARQRDKAAGMLFEAVVGLKPTEEEPARLRT